MHVSTAQKIKYVSLHAFHMLCAHSCCPAMVTNSSFVKLPFTATRFAVAPWSHKPRWRRYSSHGSSATKLQLVLFCKPSSEHTSVWSTPFRNSWERPTHCASPERLGRCRARLAAAAYPSDSRQPGTATAADRLWQLPLAAPATCLRQSGQSPNPSVSPGLPMRQAASTWTTHA